jgi:hypothetical protein
MRNTGFDTATVFLDFTDIDPCIVFFYIFW